MKTNASRTYNRLTDNQRKAVDMAMKDTNSSDYFAKFTVVVEYYRGILSLDEVRESMPKLVQIIKEINQKVWNQ